MDSTSKVPTKESLGELSTRKAATCISLYQPTHRRDPENRQDPIRYGNMLNQLRESLKQNHSDDDIKKLLKPFTELSEDRDFWNHTLDGLAIFATPDYFAVYTIPRTMPERVIVADSFHENPLRKFLQSTDQYQLLALSLDEIALYQGDRNSLQRIEAGPNIPRTIEEALGRDIDTTHPSPPAAYTANRGGRVVVTHGTGGGKDERAIDQTRWFRAVDHAVTEHLSKESHLPLILVALKEHQGEFRKLSQNTLLQPGGISINPKAVKLDDLRKMAWEVMEPSYHASLDEMKNDFHAAAAKDLGSDNIASISKAAAQGKVATLFLQEDKLMAGRIDPETGDITEKDPAHPEVDDILDDLGTLVESQKGKVLLIPAKHMPTQSGAAAIYRF